MTYYVTAMSNDKARLVHKTASVSCKTTADLIAETWKSEGFYIHRAVEG